MKYMLNAFSINLVPEEIIHKLRIVPITPAEIRREYLGGEAINSCVGHENTAVIMEKELNAEKGIASYIPIKANRQTIRLNEGDIAFIGQYIGTRLEEGATDLPQGAEIKWFKAWFPKPSVRVVTGKVRSFDFSAAYDAAVSELYEGEYIDHVSFIDSSGDGVGTFVVCNIVTKISNNGN